MKIRSDLSQFYALNTKNSEKTSASTNAKYQDYLKKVQEMKERSENILVEATNFFEDGNIQALQNLAKELSPMSSMVFELRDVVNKNKDKFSSPQIKELTKLMNAIDSNRVQISSYQDVGEDRLKEIAVKKEQKRFQDIINGSLILLKKSGQSPQDLKRHFQETMDAYNKAIDYYDKKFIEYNKVGQNARKAKEAATKLRTEKEKIEQTPEYQDFLK